MNRFSVSIVDWTNNCDQLSAIRDEVFIDEQDVPLDLERDPMDVHYTHALAQDSNGNPIGTGRLLADGKIGRMAVLRSWRGKGVGRALLHALIDAAREAGLQEVTLDSQTHARGFYCRDGFTTSGDEFMDAGIPHIKMKKDLRNP
jgi:predicted GNAT family N-acyltransferase